MKVYEDANLEEGEMTRTKKVYDDNNLEGGSDEDDEVEIV